MHCCGTAGEHIAPSRKVLWNPCITVTYCYYYFFLYFHVFLGKDTLFFSNKHSFSRSCIPAVVLFKLGAKKCIHVYLYKVIFMWLRRRPRPLMLHFAEELHCLCRECDPAYLTNNARHRCLPRICASVCLELWLNHWKYDMWVLLMFFSPRESVNRFFQ